MVCKNCGKEAPEGARFCDACGTPLTEAQENSAAQEGAQPAAVSAQPEDAQTAAAPQQTACRPQSDGGAAVPPQEPPVWNSAAYQPGAVSPSGVQPSQKKSKTDPMSTAQFFLMDLISIIPVVNLVVFIIWSFSDSVNLNRRNWARARLIWIGITLALLAIAAVGIIVALSIGYSHYGMVHGRFYW